MSESTKNIIDDGEIERVHAHADFGRGLTKRGILEKGLVSYAVGYSTGFTLMTILIEHGLIQKPKPGAFKSHLTQKGFRYLRAMMGGAAVEEVTAVMRGAE